MRTQIINSCIECPFFREGKRLHDCYYPLKSDSKTVIKLLPYYDHTNDVHYKCPLKDFEINIKLKENEN